MSCLCLVLLLWATNLVCFHIHVGFYARVGFKVNKKTCKTLKKVSSNF